MPGTATPMASTGASVAGEGFDLGGQQFDQLAAGDGDQGVEFVGLDGIAQGLAGERWSSSLPATMCSVITTPMAVVMGTSLGSRARIGMWAGDAESETRIAQGRGRRRTGRVLRSQPGVRLTHGDAGANRSGDAAPSAVLDPPVSDAEFEALCRENPDVRLERTREGAVRMNPPAGGWTSSGNGDFRPALRLVGKARARADLRFEAADSAFRMDRR
jgi:hypothetical protein